jgi:regulator of replication initiation timing
MKQNIILFTFLLVSTICSGQSRKDQIERLNGTIDSLNTVLIITRDKSAKDIDSLIEKMNGILNNVSILKNELANLQKSNYNLIKENEKLKADLDESKQSKVSLNHIIDNLEIMKKDIDETMYLPDAEKIALDMGDGWRVPTIAELNLLYHNRDIIGGFSTDRNYDETIYMSSTEINDNSATYRTIEVISFDSGKMGWDYYARGPGLKVRLVRNIK